MTLLSFLWRELTPTRGRRRATHRIARRPARPSSDVVRRLEALEFKERENRDEREWVKRLTARGQTVFITILALVLAIRPPTS